MYCNKKDFAKLLIIISNTNTIFKLEIGDPLMG